MNEELPDGVRKVPGPAVRWQIQFGAYTYDGYVFEDDPSDLARFIRWAASGAHAHDLPGRITIQKFLS